MSELYYAYVVDDLAERFDEKLSGLKNEVEVLFKCPALSEKGEPLIYYVLAAKDEVIDPKWKLA